MRLASFLPLTFIAGIDGFGWFVAYVAAVLVIFELARQLRLSLPARKAVPTSQPAISIALTRVTS